MTTRIIPCSSEEMQSIRREFQLADNHLICAQDQALDDPELHERILEIRRALAQLLNDTK